MNAESLLAASGMTAPAEPRFVAQARDYLASCEAAGINGRYHPSPGGAVKMIYHHGRAEADMIRAAFVYARQHPEPERITVLQCP
jgi:hypothetical protein